MTRLAAIALALLIIHATADLGARVAATTAVAASCGAC